MRGASRVLSMWNLPATRPGHFNHVTKRVSHSDFCQDGIIYFQLSVESNPGLYWFCFTLF